MRAAIGDHGRYAAPPAQRYIAGDEFHHTAIFRLAPFAYRYFRLVPDHPPFPNVERWYREICARPAFKEHVLDAVCVIGPIVAGMLRRGEERETAVSKHVAAPSFNASARAMPSG